MISIDRFGRTQVLENRNRGFDWNDGNWKNDHDFDFDGGRNYGDYGNHDRAWNDRRSGPGDRTDRDDSYGNNGSYGGNFGRTLSDVEFNQLLHNINRESSENNMMKSATQIITTNYLTSEQVKEMLQLFSFESNKLSLAELAYDKTVDKRNYFVVNDVFSYSNSKEELARFIRNH